jgi:ketosteroid isomerase-like protein
VPGDRIEVMRAGYAQLNNEFPKTRVLPGPLSPEIEFDYTGAIPGGVTGRGKDGFAQALGAWVDMFDDWTVEPLEFTEEGPDQVIVIVRDGGRIKSSGNEVSNEFVHLWRFDGDLVVRFAAFANKNDALEAAVS